MAFNIQGKVAVLYALYMFYKTQPYSFPKHPIPVTISKSTITKDIWNELSDIYKESLKESILEATFIFSQMVHSYSFVIVAAVSNPPTSCSSFFNSESSASKEGSQVLQKEMKELAENIDDYLLNSPDIQWHSLQNMEDRYLHSRKEISDNILFQQEFLGDRFSKELREKLDAERERLSAENENVTENNGQKNPTRRSQLRSATYANRSYTPILSKKREI